MTRSNIYTLLCTAVRLAAIYLFVDALGQVVGAIMSLHREQEQFVIMITMTSPLVQFALSLVLWFFPGILARLAASRKSLDTFESDITPDVFQYLGFSMLGAWFAVAGLSSLAYTVHRWIFLRLYLQQQLLDPTQDPKVYGTLLSEAVKIALGVALMLGSRGLVGLLRRFRETGLARPETHVSDNQ